MLIGLISDTHDNVYKIEEAVKIFNDRGVKYVLHGGDHIAPFTLNWFKPLKAKLIGVTGNLDAEYFLLKKRYEELGWTLYREITEVDFGGKIVLTHGLSERVVRALALSGEYDVVVRGHTHTTQSDLVGETLIVNPGEACGYLGGKSTIAVLKMPEREVEFIEL